MGGSGSGRTGGWPTVERTEALVISADKIVGPVMRKLRGDGFSTIPDGERAEVDFRSLNWSRDGEVWASIDVRLSLEPRSGRATLRYDVDHFSRRTGPQEQAIEMVTLTCYFGGVRWFWVCPGTGRRVSKLYLPNGAVQFRGRGPKAYRLAYQSQRNGTDDAAHARLRRIFRKLNAEYEGLGSFAPKPKGMHWRTYDDLCAQIDDQEGILNDGMAHLVERLMNRHPPK
jgi:hypothetical protein